MAADANVSNVNKNTNSMVKFFKDIKSEFRKITWPSRQDTIRTTEVVFATLALFVLILWLYDSVFGYVLKVILQYLK